MEMLKKSSPLLVIMLLMMVPQQSWAREITAADVLSELFIAEAGGRLNCIGKGQPCGLFHKCCDPLYCTDPVIQGTCKEVPCVKPGQTCGLWAKCCEGYKCTGSVKGYCMQTGCSHEGDPCDDNHTCCRNSYCDSGSGTCVVISLQQPST